MGKKYNEIAVLIPAYQPDGELIQIVNELKDDELNVLVVDDGSVGCDCIFDEIADKCMLIRYQQNRGKGYALKTGLRYLFEEGFSFAVTADADGQHAIADILKLCEMAKEDDNALVLGSRRIEDMPLRSKFGNQLTKNLFRILYGLKITDTQTGLRLIPLKNIEALTKLEGERYEFEMNMLVESNSIFSLVKEVPIKTIYIGENESSHFNPLRDGMKIYRVLFKKVGKFLGVSLSSALIDFCLFAIFFYTIGLKAVLSTIFARAVSSTYNYLANKKYVFNTTSKKYTFHRYILLVISFMITNSGAMYVLVDLMRLQAVAVKIVIETILWMMSYSIQRKWADS